MASLADIHGALAGRLATIDGLRVTPNPDQGVSPPVAWVQMTGWTQEAFGRRGPRMVELEVYAFTAQSIRPQDGYGLLITYADPELATSIVTAIWDGNAAGTYAGSYQGVTYTCARTQVMSIEYRLLGRQEVDEYQMYGGVFTVVAHTST